MQRLRRWQSRLDCPHHPFHPNTWARHLWVRRWALAMATAGNPRPSLFAWLVVVENPVSSPSISPRKRRKDPERKVRSPMLRVPVKVRATIQTKAA